MTKPKLQVHLFKTDLQLKKDFRIKLQNRFEELSTPNTSTGTKILGTAKIIDYNIG